MVIERHDSEIIGKELIFRFTGGKNIPWHMVTRRKFDTAHDAVIADQMLKFLIECINKYEKST